jgi:hypothetical protein
MATHQMSVALEKAIDELLGVFNFAQWSRDERQATAFAPGNYHPVLQSGGLEAMRSPRFVGEGARCKISEPENLAGGSRGAYNSMITFSKTFDKTMVRLTSRADIYLSRLSDEQGWGGDRGVGESG